MIGGDGDPDMLLVAEVIVIVLDRAQLAQHRMVREVVGRPETRQRDLIERIEIEELRRRHERKMRADERDEEAPGLLGRRCGLALKPADGLVADVAVVAQIGGIAFAGVTGELPRRHPLGRRPAQHALDVAFAVQHVERKDLVVEAVRVVAAPVVQLADRIAPVAGLVKAVAEGGRRAGIGKGVVPIADLVDITARGKARPRRHADRAVAVGVLEERTLCRQPVHVGRLDIGVAIGAENTAAVLVGHDEENILSGHRHPPLI